MDLKFKDNSKLRIAALTQLEYIESTGTQYIDTGIVAKVTDNFEIEYQFINGSGERSVFGIHGSSQANMIMYDGWWWGGNSRYSFSQGTTKHILTKNNNIWTLDGTQLSYTTNSGNIPTGNWSLFTAKSGSDYTTRAATAKIYRFKLYRGNTLIVDFVPVLDANRTPCMYDTISKTYLYNQGTGDFVAGPVVNADLPANIILKTTTLYHKNTPNVNGSHLLNDILKTQETAEDVVLNRIRVDIGNVSGSISELLQYAGMAGFNDNYEPQTKPRLVGTWTINDWYTTAQLAQARAAFDGLTIVEDPNYVIDFSQMAVQVLDNTQPYYNPAVAIILQAAGYGNTLQGAIINGGGRWFIDKSDYENISIGNIFANKTTVADTNNIIDGGSYDFEYIKLPYSCTTMPNFDSCSKLKEIYGENVTSAGTTTCRSTNLNKITTKLPFSTANSTWSFINVPSGVSWYGLGTFIDFCNSVISFNNTPLNAGHGHVYINDILLSGSVIIPNNLTTVSALFLGNDDITSIDIGNITSIPENFATACRNLTSVITNTIITTVGKGAFSGCTNLTRIEFPATLTYIGDQAFRDSGLRTVILYSTTPPTLHSTALFGCNNATFYVPDANVNDYKSAWSNVSSRIKGISEIPV